MFDMMKGNDEWLAKPHGEVINIKCKHFIKSGTTKVTNDTQEAAQVTFLFTGPVHCSHGTE